MTNLHRWNILWVTSWVPSEVTSRVQKTWFIQIVFLGRPHSVWNQSLLRQAFSFFIKQIHVKHIESFLQQFKKSFIYKNVYWIFNADFLSNPYFDILYHMQMTVFVYLASFAYIYKNFLRYICPVFFIFLLFFNTKTAVRPCTSSTVRRRFIFISQTTTNTFSSAPAYPLYRFHYAAAAP